MAQCSNKILHGRTVLKIERGEISIQLPGANTPQSDVKSQIKEHSVVTFGAVSLF